MRETRRVHSDRIQRGHTAPRSAKHFDTISPRKTCYLMRQFNHISDKSDLFIKNRQ
jgi:hypothetical protein